MHIRQELQICEGLCIEALAYPEAILAKPRCAWGPSTRLSLERETISFTYLSISLSRENHRGGGCPKGRPGATCLRLPGPGAPARARGPLRLRAPPRHCTGPGRLYGPPRLRAPPRYCTGPGGTVRTVLPRSPPCPESTGGLAGRTATSPPPAWWTSAAAPRSRPARRARRTPGPRRLTDGRHGRRGGAWRGGPPPLPGDAITDAGSRARAAGGANGGWTPAERRTDGG